MLSDSSTSKPRISSAKRTPGLLFLLWLCATIASSLPAQAQTPPTTEEALTYWRSRLDSAYAMQAAATPGWGNEVRLVAAQLATWGALTEALSALDHVLAAPESPFETAEAHRMRGQYLRSRGELVASNSAFSSQLAVFDANPFLKQACATVYASGISQLTGGLRNSGNLAGAILVNDRILSETFVSFSDGNQQTALLNRVALRREQSDSNATAAAIDALFGAFPKYGADNGDFIRLKAERTDCVPGNSLGADAHATLLQQVFEDEASRPFPQRLAVGRSAIDALIQSGSFSRTYELAQAMLDTIDKYGPKWLETKLPGVPPFTATHLRDAEISILSLLQGAEDHGRPDLSLTACLRLRNLATSASQVVYWKEQYDAVVRRNWPQP